MQNNKHPFLSDRKLLDNCSLRRLLTAATSDKNAVGELKYEHGLRFYEVLCTSGIFLGRLFPPKVWRVAVPIVLNLYTTPCISAILSQQ